MEQQPNKKKRRTVWLIAGILAAVLTSTGIYYWINNSAWETTDNAQLDGNIEPVRSSISAYVDTICFKDNQHVKKGDTLLLLNKDALLAKVQQAAAALDNATAAVLASGNKASASFENANAALQTSQYNQQNIVSAKANLDKAQQDLARATDLLKIRAATQEQYETIQTKWQIARADYARETGKQQSSVSTSLGLKATVRSDKDQISTAKALVKQRQAELLLAQLELQHACITAPSDGIVARRTVEEGQYVLAGQTLCAVIDTSHLWVSANFKETQLSKIKPGQEVAISVDAWPGLSLKGHVESFGGATGAKFSLLPPDNSTGNFIKITQRFPLRISIDNFFMSGNKPTVLFAGLSAFVKVKTN